MKLYFRQILLASLLSITSGASLAAHYLLSVQPVLPADQVRQSYAPLASYLSAKTGHTFSIKTYRNFLTYWARMQKAKDMHFILDAAHFTDFRVQRKNYRVLVKLPDTVSFTVVTGEENFIFEMDELISRKIATMAAPGMGAVRLSSMFPNPVRLPFYLEASNSVDAVNKVLDGAVDAAVLWQGHAKKAGIDIKVVKEPVDGYWDNVWNKKGFSACFWFARVTCDWMFTMAYAAGASANDMHWKHDRFNKLLVEARGELDQNKRKALYGEMQAIVSNEGGVVIPMIANMVDAASKKVNFDQPAGNQELDGLRACERWWFA